MTTRLSGQVMVALLTGPGGATARYFDAYCQAQEARDYVFSDPRR